MAKERKYREEIVPYALPTNSAEVCEIGIAKMSITYIQEDDTNHNEGDDVQTLTVETEEAICNREDALNKESYYLTIQTDRWAIEEPEDILLVLNDFKEKLYSNVDKLKEQEGKKEAKILPKGIKEERELSIQH